jgi:hypothetical protein
MGIEIKSGTVMPFEKVYYQTVNNNDLHGQALFIEAFFENWVGEFVHPLGKDLHHCHQLENSFYLANLTAQSVVFDWLAYTLLSGAYDIVLRELRCILEGLFAAYYVDMKYKGENLSQKVQRLSVLEEKRVLSGKKVFESSKLNNWKDYYSLYNELCAHVHNSIKVIGSRIIQIAEDGFPQALEPQFDEVTFASSAELWRQVAITAIDLAMALFHELHVTVKYTNFDLLKTKLFAITSCGTATSEK